MHSQPLLTLLFFTCNVFLAITSATCENSHRHPIFRRGQSVLNVKREDADPTVLYPVHNLSVPVDHFHNDSMYVPHSDGMFNLRYWFDATHYAAGGPVIVLESGETSGENRLPFLQKGIVAQLAEETHGIGVILEHRYYGMSFPTPDLSTKNLRFLTTAQALADTAYFAQNVAFPGLEGQNLTATQVPWIAYGGSYAGAFVSFLRVLYPDIFWGAISSSGVTKAIYDYWQYYEPIREYGPPDCVATTQHLTDAVDNILIGHANSSLVSDLKNAFNLGNVTYNNDFAYVLSFGISGWQGRNWDPAVNDLSFSQYCDNITSDEVLYPETSILASSVYRLLSAANHGDLSDALISRMLNWIGYVNATQVTTCAERNQTQDQCFSTHNQTYYNQDDLSQTWRSWPYQYCSQWGYLQGGASVPQDQLPLISRTIDIPYLSLICVEAFNITGPSDTAAINKYGGYNISYPRLAFIDGEQDPWRIATPHAPKADQSRRTDTANEPFVLIAGAVHHWDENGLFPNETTAELPPQPVADTQMLEAQFVQEWMMEAQLQFDI
jgi:Serine carboxypeptidase S28